MLGYPSFVIEKSSEATSKNVLNFICINLLMLGYPSYVIAKRSEATSKNVLNFICINLLVLGYPRYVIAKRSEATSKLLRLVEPTRIVAKRTRSIQRLVRSSFFPEHQKFFKTKRKILSNGNCTKWYFIYTDTISTFQKITSPENPLPESALYLIHAFILGNQILHTI
jgi:hypothetical protein